MAGQVEVVEAREQVAVGADHEDLRSARRQVHGAEASTQRAAHLVAVIQRQPRVVERQPPATAAQRPDVRDLCGPDRGMVACRIGPALVLEWRDDRPRPGDDVARQRVARAGPERRAPARGPVERRRVLQRVVHRVDPARVVERDHLVVVERDRRDAAVEAEGQRQGAPRTCLGAPAYVDLALAGGELVEAVEGLGLRAQVDVPREQSGGRFGPRRRDARDRPGGCLIGHAGSAALEGLAALLADALVDGQVGRLGECGRSGGQRESDHCDRASHGRRHAAADDSEDASSWRRSGNPARSGKVRARRRLRLLPLGRWPSCAT